MILKPDIVKRILSGKQTTLRRTRPPAEKQGRSYAIKTSRSRDPACHITILEIREQLLGSITLREVRREGHRTTLDWRESWIEQHGEYDPEQMIWVLSFELGDNIEHERIPAARIGPGGAYTSTAARGLNGAGTEVSEHLQHQYSVEAELGFRMASSAQWEEARARLLAVIAEIRDFASDPRINENLRGLERQARSLERKLDRAAS